MSVSIFVGRGSDDDLNLSNHNFRGLMELIDQPINQECLCGTFEGEEIANLYRKIQDVLDGIAAMPELDGGTPTIVDQEPGKVTMIHCGLRPGYYQSRLEALSKLCVEALCNKLPIHFG